MFEYILVISIGIGILFYIWLVSKLEHQEEQLKQLNQKLKYQAIENVVKNLTEKEKKELSKLKTEYVIRYIMKKAAAQLKEL